MFVSSFVWAAPVPYFDCTVTTCAWSAAPYSTCTWACRRHRCRRACSPPRPTSRSTSTTPPRTSHVRNQHTHTNATRTDTHATLTYEHMQTTPCFRYPSLRVLIVCVCPLLTAASCGSAGPSRAGWLPPGGAARPPRVQQRDIQQGGAVTRLHHERRAAGGGGARGIFRGAPADTVHLLCVEPQLVGAVHHTRAGGDRVFLEGTHTQTNTAHTPSTQHTAQAHSTKHTAQHAQHSIIH